MPCNVGLKHGHSLGIKHLVILDSSWEESLLGIYPKRLARDAKKEIYVQYVYCNVIYTKKVETILRSNSKELLEKAMAPHSSTLAWKSPWMEEPGRLQSMGSLRVGHDWATLLSLFTFMHWRRKRQPHWRRKWQPTPEFLLGESQGRGKPGGLPSMGLHRVEHDWSDLAAAAARNCSTEIMVNPPNGIFRSHYTLVVRTHVLDWGNKCAS